MKVLFSKKCEYGLLATLYIGTKESGSQTSAEEISSKLNIPKEFVAKILQKLKHSGILGSKKGKSGGFNLAKEPSEISLFDIVQAIDGNELFEGCLIGFPNCSHQKPCPVHNQWANLRDDLKNLLMYNTLESVKEIFEKKILREITKT